MQYQYTVHQTSLAYEGFFKVNQHTVSFEKFTGGAIEKVTRECGQKGDVVAVIPYDPTTQEILMVEQFRIGMAIRGKHPWNQEIVAGFMDVPREDKESSAKRELVEETGCTAKTMHRLISYYPSPGGSAAKVHVFVAVIDVNHMKQYTGITEEGEDICVHRIPIATMREKTLANEIDNATTIIAFQQFFLNNWTEKLATMPR